MNVKGFKELLNKYPDSAIVLATWEGTFHEIEEDSLYLAPGGEFIIDVDANSYRDDILSGELLPKT